MIVGAVAYLGEGDGAGGNQGNMVVISWWLNRQPLIDACYGCQYTVVNRGFKGVWIGDSKNVIDS